MWTNPFEEMKRLRMEMNKILDRMFSSALQSQKTLPVATEKSLQSFRQPVMSIRETGKDLILTMEIPGVDKKDIQLNVTEDSIEVKAEKKHETRVEKKGYLSEEMSYKGFYKSMSLPAKTIPSQAKATYKDGILEVILPKAGKKKTEKTRKIEVK